MAKPAIKPKPKPSPTKPTKGKVSKDTKGIKIIKTTSKVELSPKVRAAAKTAMAKAVAESNRSKAAKSSKAKAAETIAVKATQKAAATPPQKPTAPMRSTYLTIHNLRQWMSDEFEKATKEQPTLAQFEVLNAIAQADGPSQTHIGRVTGMDRSTIAEVMRRLVTRGFVTRQRTAEDERAYAVSLTSSGIAHHKLGVTVMAKIEEKLSSVQGFHGAVNWSTKVLDTFAEHTPGSYSERKADVRIAKKEAFGEASSSDDAFEDERVAA